MKNKQIIKKESKDLYDFFLIEEKKILSLYESKIQSKKEEIRKISNLEGKELLKEFSIEEKINSITLNKKGLSNLSSDINTGIQIEFLNNKLLILFNFFILSFSNLSLISFLLHQY